MFAVWAGHFTGTHVRWRQLGGVASISKIASPSQGVGYFEKDGYYTRDDAAHREASAWAGRRAAARSGWHRIPIPGSPHRDAD